MNPDKYKSMMISIINAHIIKQILLLKKKKKEEIPVKK
jgi:hypothetical protein